MKKQRKLMPQFKAALRSWDKDNAAVIEWANMRATRRAAFACFWFIENASDGYPDKTDVFFKVREIYRGTAV